MKNVILLAAPLALAGCAAGDAGARFTVRDSAGVTIAESAGPAWGPEEVWRIDPEPLLDIGTTAGEEPYVLSRVRGAVRLPDGGVVVSDGATATLRWYDAGGRFLFQRGGRGGGPDEFSTPPVPLAQPGPDPVVATAGRDRMAVFTALGERQDVVLETPGVYYQGTARLPDGRFVGVQRLADLPEEGIHRADIRLVLAAPGGLDTLGTFPGPTTEMTVSRTDDQGRVMSFLLGQPTFAPQTTFAVRGDGVLVGTADAHQVLELDASGAVRRIVRWAGRDLATAEEDRQAVVENALRLARERGETELGAVEAQAREARLTERRSAYAVVRADPAGRLWVQLDRVRSDPMERHLVFDADGRLLGELALPERFTTHQVGDGWILGTWRDEMDVEHVRLYGVLR